MTTRPVLGLCLTVALAASDGRPLGAQDDTATRPDPATSASYAGQPLSAPMRPGRFSAGAWSIMLHGRADIVWTRAPGARGDAMLFSVNHVMVMAARPLGGGTLGLRAMATLEPSMGPRGYPLLLQTGESADGRNPLVDRQHPHDAIMEMSASWRRALPQDLVFSADLAAVGDPAIGPPVFMHRASGRDIPVAPLAHHHLDATHITHGVFTVGLLSRRRLQIELSAFNGLEPDQDRWRIEQPRFDSFAFRTTVYAGQDFALQGSVASIASPERMHPGIDQLRVTASAIWNRSLSNGNWQTTLALGRNKSDRTLIPVPEARATFPAPVLDHYLSLADSSGVAADSLTLLFPTRVRWALLLESTVKTGRSTGFLRFEAVEKDELFPPTDARHSHTFPVNKLDVGYTLEVQPFGSGRFGLGLAAAFHFLPSALHEAYGKRPTSIYTFVTADF